MKLVSVQEMIEIEKQADQSGLSYAQMMENAGQGLANYLIGKFKDSKDKRICGLIGKGNNGGDTIIALEILQKNDWKVSALEAADRGIDPLLAGLTSLNIDCKKIEELSNSELRDFLDTALILDGVFGTGIRLPLRESAAVNLGRIKTVINSIQPRPLIAAVDCPSGMDCDSGELAEEALKADLTIAMAAAKKGFFRFPGAEYIGGITKVDIGLPVDMPKWKTVSSRVLGIDELKEMVPDRPAIAHKGTFGAVRVIAGSEKYPGAAYLAAKAAYTVGAGLVTIAGPQLLQGALAGSIPEATWLLQPDGKTTVSEALIPLLDYPTKMNTAAVIGPGFDILEDTEKFIRTYLAEHREDESPHVFDADALKILAAIENWWEKIPENSILTPHPGEMSVLTGFTTAEIQNNRLDTAKTYAEKWNCIVVLKGAFTIIAQPSGKVSLNPTASAALAKAGSGDVLAGMIGGFLAQGISLEDAACLAVWLHARSGQLAELRSPSALYTFSANDIIRNIGSPLDEIKK